MLRTKIFITTIMVFLIMTASAAIAGNMHTGLVKEAMTAGGYTYMLINENGREFWIAGPATDLKAGAQVSFDEQMVMQNFTSKALDRTFDAILFVGTISPAIGERVEAEPGTHAMFSSVFKNAKTYTVAELTAKKKELNGKAIKVRGEVVKVSERIMGRNWVHVKDETGKIVFRTKSSAPPVGTVVTAQGIFETDKDFGGGYFYEMIVEDSSFIK